MRRQFDRRRRASILKKAEEVVSEDLISNTKRCMYELSKNAVSTQE